MYTQIIKVSGACDKRSLHIEHGLAHLEGEFAHIRKEFIEKRKKIPTVPAVKLIMFMVAQQARTPAYREHIRNHWAKVASLMEEFQGSVRRMTQEQRKAAARIPSLPSGRDDTALDYDQVQQMVRAPLQNTIVSQIETITPLVHQVMKIQVLCAKSGANFITSDNPCVWFDPDSRKRPVLYQHPGLMYPSLEITMPLTPSKMLFLTRNEGESYVDVNDEIVHELNRRTRYYSAETFINNCSSSHPWWYIS